MQDQQVEAPNRAPFSGSTLEKRDARVLATLFRKLGDILRETRRVDPERTRPLYARLEQATREAIE